MFFAASVSVAKQPLATSGRWQDQSTADYFIFRSSSGTLKLRKRPAYPATFVETDGTILKAGYGDLSLAEKVAAQTTPTVPDAAAYSEEFFLLEIDIEAQTVRIQRDAFCTLPLFVAHNDTKLSLANNFDIACSPFSGDELRLDKNNLFDFIVDRKTDTLDTFFENCITPVALERVDWAKGTLHRERLRLADQTSSNEYDEDPKLFRQFLDALLAEYAQKYAHNQRVGVEFSGGIDSAMVAGYLADHGNDPLLVTAGFTGPFRQSQQQKIADFQARFKTQHIVVDLDEETLAPLSRTVQADTKPFYPFEGTYTEAAVALTEHLVDNGVTAVYNGHGGDDVLARFDFEHTEQSLPPFFTKKFKKYERPASMSQDKSRAAMSNQFTAYKIDCNNVYIDQGIWPVAPFADPRLLLYCQSLKPRFRDNKNIYRMYCHAWQYPESIYHPIINEDFADFFNACMERHRHVLATKWLERSKLVQAGLVDKELLSEYLQHMRTDEEYFHFYKLIAIESNLQMLGIHV